MKSLKKTVLNCLLALTAVITASTAQAADIYRLDSSHTNVMWFGSHFGFSDSLGQFMDFKGTIVMDEKNLKNSSVEVKIKTDSIMTGLSKFDEHLKGKDFFDVKNFPEATFRSNSVKMVEKDVYDVSGVLTLLGKKSTIILRTKVNQIGVNPYNKKKTAGFSVTGVIKRSEFGMMYGIDWGIKDEVDIKIEAEAILEK